jgi:hypothetical protein
MQSPELDIEDRKPIWDLMQYFWMDTDPNILLPKIVEVCVNSKYSLGDIEAIFWNEVYPAVSFNMLLFPAPEWAGFEINWLVERILKKNRYGRRLPWRWLSPYSNSWWKKLSAEILDKRKTH